LGNSLGYYFFAFFDLCAYNKMDRGITMEDNESFYAELIGLVRFLLCNLDNGFINETEFFNFVLLYFNCPCENIDESLISEEIKMIRGALSAVDEGNISSMIAFELISKRCSMFMADDKSSLDKCLVLRHD
jgi:hypothetical protein